MLPPLSDWIPDTEINLKDGGWGEPTLEAKSEYFDDWGAYSYSFGWIYSGLASIGLVTEEWEIG